MQPRRGAAIDGNAGTLFDSVVLRRGMTLDDCRLCQWCNSVSEGGVGEPIAPKDEDIKPRVASGVVILSWKVSGAWPLRRHHDV